MSDAEYEFKGLHQLYRDLDSELLINYKGEEFLPCDRTARYTTYNVVSSALKEEGVVKVEMATNFVCKDAQGIFLILCLMKELHNLEWFIEGGITDRALPLRPDGDRFVFQNTIQAFPNWDRDVQLHFMVKQGKAMPPIFGKGKNFRHHLHWTAVLPFLDDPESYKDAGDDFFVSGFLRDATKLMLHRAHIHEDFLLSFERLGLLPRDPASKGVPVAVQPGPWANKVTITDLRELLPRSSESNHLMEPIGVYQLNNMELWIYPWADGGHLGTYFDTFPKDQLEADDVLWVFREVVGLWLAIYKLHNSDYVHGDLAIDNILWFKSTSRKGTLQIADARPPIFRERKNWIFSIERRRYDAPEQDRRGDSVGPPSRYSDVWSMGRVMLELLIWLHYGVQGLKLFQEKMPGRLWKATRDEGPNTRSFSIDPYAETCIRAMEQDPNLCKAYKILLGFIKTRLLIIPCARSYEPEDNSANFRATAREAHQFMADLYNDTKSDPGSFLNNDCLRRSSGLPKSSTYIGRFFEMHPREPDTSAMSSSAGSITGAKLIDPDEIEQATPTEDTEKEHEQLLNGMTWEAEASNSEATWMNTNGSTAIVTIIPHTDETSVESQLPASDSKNAQDYDDTNTMYSDMSSVDGESKDAYISELTQNLVKHFEKCLSQVGKQIGENEESLLLKSVTKILPDLLGAFSISLGYNKSTQMSRDIMVFVHKYRSAIAESFEKSFYDSRNNANRMTLSEKMEAWQREEPGELDEPGEPDELDELNKQDKQDEPDEQDEQDEESVISDKIDEWSENEIRLSNIEEPPDSFNENDAPSGEESTILENILKYSDQVQKTEAYEWLLKRLDREVLLTHVGPNIMDKIHQNILKCLSKCRTVSRKASPVTQEMLFRVDWNPRSFVKCSDHGVECGKTMSMAVTLTGSETNAQLLSCAEYLSQTWPMMEQEFLQLLDDITQNIDGTEHTYKLHDGTRLAAWIESENSCLVVKGSGTPCSLAEVAEALAWLGSALRTHPSPTLKDSSIMYCRPILSRTVTEDDLEHHGSISWDIRFETRKNAEDRSSSSGQCWSGLFKSAVVVEGYPILRRREQRTGLEIPLDVIASLIQATHATTFDGKIFIKGCWAMMVLVKAAENVIIWHLIFQKGDTQASYLDPRITNLPSEGIEQVKLSDVLISRHVVGWCSKVEKCIEGQTPDRHGRFSLSDLNEPGENCRFKDMRIPRGVPLVSRRSDRVCAIKFRGCAPPDGYLDRIKKSRDRFIVMFDAGHNRAWLVDGASALLHLVLTSLEGDRADKDFGRFSTFELKKPSITIANYAVNVLMEEGNKNQNLHKESTEKFTDRVNDIWCILDLFSEYQQKINEQDNTARELLEGFEFKDIVARQAESFGTRVKLLHPCGLTWVGLTRNLNAVTIFGHEFNPMIKHVGVDSTCCDGKELPMGMSCLAVCMRDLQEVKEGYLAGLHWHSPDRECQKSPRECSYAPILFFEQVHNGEDTGGVIFGDVSKSSLETKDRVANFESGRGSSTSRDTGYIGTSTSPSRTSQRSSHASPHLSSPMSYESNMRTHTDIQYGSEVPAFVTNTPRPSDTPRKSLENIPQQTVPANKAKPPNEIQIEFNHTERASNISEGIDTVTVPKLSKTSDSHISDKSPSRISVSSISIVKQAITWFTYFTWSMMLCAFLMSHINPDFYCWVVFVSASLTQLYLHVVWVWNNHKVNTRLVGVVKLFIVPILFFWWFILPTHVYTWTPLDLWNCKIDYSSVPTYQIVHDSGLNPVVDVFAIHGLGSNASNAWRYHGDYDVLWLKDLLPKETGCDSLRITMLNHHTSWCDNVPALDMKDYAQRLLNDVRDLNQGKRPIIFIAHSFGGLLLKQALELAADSKSERSKFKSIAEQTRGILFLGVPHYGTKASFLASLLSCTAYWRGSSTVLLKMMAEGNPDLERLDENFHGFYNEAGNINTGSGTYVQDFVEANSEKIWQMPVGFTVDYRLGKGRYPKNPIKLRTDHRGLNKFRSADDSEFRTFFGYFKEALDFAQKKQHG